MTSLVGRRVRLLTTIGTTCGPAAAGTLGRVLVGQPDRQRPRGHPARRVQVRSDATTGWGDVDVDGVELLPDDAPAPTQRPEAPAPSVVQAVAPAVVALLQGERERFERELLRAQAEADAAHAELVAECAELRRELTLARIEAAALRAGAPEASPLPEAYPLPEASPSPDATPSSPSSDG